MHEWFKFWYDCFVIGLGIGKGVCMYIEVFSGLLWAWLRFRKVRNGIGQWEVVVKKWSGTIFILMLISGTIAVAPYQLHKNTLEKYGSNGICWAPAKADWNDNRFMLLFGRQPYPFNLDELRGNKSTMIKLKDSSTKEYPAITAHFKDDRVYFDAEIPSGYRHVKIEYGESEILPKGWDWASDSKALEIVDDQHRVVFREQIVSTNVIQIQGTVVFQHYTLTSSDYGSINVGINAGFDVNDFYLTPN